MGQFPESSGNGVTSFNTRIGAVTAANGDYTVSQITGAAPLANPTFTGSTRINSLGIGVAADGTAGDLTMVSGGLIKNTGAVVMRAATNGYYFQSAAGVNQANVDLNGIYTTQPGSAGGLNTAGSCAITTPSPSSGVAFTPSTTRDTSVYINVAATTAGTVAVTMGLTTGAENTPVPSTNLLALSGQNLTLRVPAGWKVVITITGTTVSFTVVVSTT